MSNQNPKIDLKTLLQNLKDLDNVSQKVSKEIANKNQILQGGLRDCDQCRTYVNNNRNRSKKI